MKKILVAYDGTAGAELALKDMVRGGFPERAEAKVLALADVWLPPVPPDSIAAEHPNYGAAHEKAADLLRDASKIAILGARHLHEIFPHWTITNTAKADSPAWGIVAEARRWDADLIVIGSHGRTPLEKFFLGSVSYKVAAEAFCSVRIVRPRRQHSHKPAQILLGVDGSSDSQGAVTEVLDRHWTSGTEVHLATVVDPKLKSSLLRSEKSLGGIEDRIKPMLEDFRSKFAARDITAHTHILEGEPKASLLRQAEKLDADSIFLGARGLEHGDRLYLGTLASAICTRAHCSVEIVRRAG
ncbi:MAG: universal stress protein [Limisphaerales bacterium]